MSKNVNSIICTDIVKIDPSTETVCYKIEYENGAKRNVFVNIPKYHKPYKSERIIDRGLEFVNGFKVVKLANNHYSYIRESDNMLMPCEYDVAFDFNEYGYAMVGKAGSVSWIDKNFNYLDFKGNMVSEKEDSWKKFEGWQAIYQCSLDANPLSRLYCGNEKYGRTAYFDMNGNLKKFYQYNGTISQDIYRDQFFTGTNFINNYAFADNFILSATGFCISKEDIINLCMEDGYIDLLFDDAKHSSCKIMKK